LPFPFNMRISMAFWNLLFLDNARFAPDATKSALVNRGEYLTIALAHCDTCHTPRNALMAEIGGKAMGGASLSSWYAPNITPDPQSGIGRWSDKDLLTYLKTGDAPGVAQAGGPMAEAVEHSFQYLSDDDLKAIIAYLRQIPALHDAHDRNPRAEYGARIDTDAQLRGTPVPEHIASGALLFSGECAACHRPDGKGSVDHYYPQLFHNSALGATNPDNLISTILMGVKRSVDHKNVYMPGFGKGSYVDELSDQQIADVASYVEQKFGNPDVTINAEQVRLIRNGGAKPFIALIGPYVAPGMAGCAGLVFLVLIGLVFVRRKKT